MKRLLSLAIIASFAMSYTVPVMAIENTKTEKQTVVTRNEKVSPSTNKYDYVNMTWWEGFNDPIMTGYIIKAVENNKDLKIWFSLRFCPK